MTLLVPWLCFPLVLGVLALGSGLTVDRAARMRVPGVLLLPVGLATITVVASLATAWSGTARLTVPALVSIAVFGLALSWRRCRRPDVAAVVCAGAAFLAVGAPVLASGESTFAGYVKLDDTATFLALTDRVLEHGRDLDRLGPSSYEATLAVNLAQGYPTGALLPLGAGAELVGTDPAWVFQPYLAFLAAMLALTLYGLAAPVVRTRPWRALVATLASQPALLYGFALWGGVKELYVAAALGLVAGTVSLARSEPRAALVTGVAVAALVLALSAGAAVWLVPLLAVVLAATATRHRRAAAAAVVTAAALATPALVEADRFLRHDNREVLRATSELGNLRAPLDPLQVLGIWPAGDFRAEPGDPGLTYVVLVLAAVAAALGLVVALRERAGALLLFAATCGFGAAFVSVLGSPWLEAKAFAVASPAVLLLALVGAVRLLRRQRVAAVALLAALGGGVLASNALAYRDASLAPRAKLAELEAIGKRFAGHSPALMTEYQPYGVRHFLRGLEPEGASELRRRPVPLSDGRLLEKGQTADLDRFSPETLLAYRTLVLQRSPAGSRPPAPYALAWRGRFYDVWLRAQSPVVRDHLSLGNASSAIGRPSCSSVRRLAGAARAARGLLAAATSAGESPVYVTPSRAAWLCGRSFDWIEVVAT